MNYELKTNSFFEEDDSLDVESTEVMAHQHHRSKKILRLGLACMVLGIVGLAGLNHVGSYPFNRPITPLQYLNMAQDKFMQAFPIRALADAADFEVTMEGVFKEVGSADPSAMSMNVTTQVGQDKREWPVTIFTFIALSGKEQILKERFEAILKGLVDIECKHSEDADCKKMSDIVKIAKGEDSPHFGKGNFVFVEIQMPNGQQGQDAEEEFTATFKEHDVKFLAEVSFGRTIEDMYHNINTNIAELPKGLHVKVSAAFASTLFAALVDLSMGPAKQDMGFAKKIEAYMKIMMGFAKLKTRNEILYKTAKDLGDSFGVLPTLAEEIPKLKQSFQSMPHTITKPMTDLHELCSGVAGIEVEGLPGGWELLAKFENFHPSKVLSSILTE